MLMLLGLLPISVDWTSMGTIQQRSRVVSQAYPVTALTCSGTPLAGYDNSLQVKDHYQSLQCRMLVFDNNRCMGLARVLGLCAS